MITHRYLLRENNELRQELKAAREQLEAACEALGNAKLIDNNVYQQATEGTDFSPRAVGGVLKFK